MAKSNSTDAFRVITPLATVSYPHFLKPQAAKEGQKAKHSGTFIFAKGSDLTKLKAAALGVAVKKWGTTWKLPNGAEIPIAQAFAENILRSPFRTDALAKGYPEGSTFINARSEQKPGCVYLHNEPGTDKPAKIPDERLIEELYAGAQVIASVKAFAYDNNGNRGVSFALNNVQKRGEGARLDNRVMAEDEFDAELDSVPADDAALFG
jgi:hypothetical protein